MELFRKFWEILGWCGHGRSRAQGRWELRKRYSGHSLPSRTPGCAQLVINHSVAMRFVQHRLSSGQRPGTHLPCVSSRKGHWGHKPWSRAPGGMLRLAQESSYCGASIHLYLLNLIQCFYKTPRICLPARVWGTELGVQFGLSFHRGATEMDKPSAGRPARTPQEALQRAMIHLPAAPGHAAGT